MDITISKKTRRNASFNLQKTYNSQLNN